MKTERVTSSDDITWTQQGPGNAGMSDNVRYHPTKPDTLFFNPDMGGNYQSDNNGTSWYNVRDYDGENHLQRLQDVQYSSKNPDLALALEKAHLFKSTDRGKSWSMVSNCPWYEGPNGNGSDSTSWIGKVSAF